MTYVIRLDGEPRMQAAAGILGQEPSFDLALHVARSILGDTPTRVTLQHDDRTLIVEAVKGDG